MAKTKTKAQPAPMQPGDNQSGDLTELNESVAPAEAVETVESPQGIPMTLWRVELECPTPLAHNPAEVMAFDEAQAWQVFLAKNGISGTKHKRTITAVESVSDPNGE